MKIKRLCVLAVLLTSSLAGAASNSASKSEDKYYAGLNFGAGWGGGFKMKPGVVLGYHYDQNSKFELEVLSNIKSLKSIGASLLVNYRFYPDLDIDPVKLYVSGGLGGYLQITPFGFGVSDTVDGDGNSSQEEKEKEEETQGAPESGGEAAGSSVVDKILSSISYKLKLGVDYEITPQIIGAVGMTMGGQLSGIKAKQIPDATLEIGVRYNF